MWCAARSYEEVLNIAEPSGWADGVPMGSDLMLGMDRCFFLLEMKEERVRKVDGKKYKDT